ncbi:MAG: hypothetical protein FWG98_13100, partial [Candidatus Cloacimonetes bacterium]|nr:hypothetical protein [Candidatus Cloacimonadota bacterium]
FLLIYISPPKVSTFRGAVCSGGACLRQKILYNGKLDGGKLRHYNHKLLKVDTYDLYPPPIIFHGGGFLNSDITYPFLL